MPIDHLDDRGAVNRRPDDRPVRNPARTKLQALSRELEAAELSLRREHAGPAARTRGGAPGPRGERAATARGEGAGPRDAIDTDRAGGRRPCPVRRRRRPRGSPRQGAASPRPRRAPANQPPPGADVEQRPVRDVLADPRAARAREVRGEQRGNPPRGEIDAHRGPARRLGLDGPPPGARVNETDHALLAPNRHSPLCMAAGPVRRAATRRHSPRRAAPRRRPARHTRPARTLLRPRSAGRKPRSGSGR